MNTISKYFLLLASLSFFCVGCTGPHSEPTVDAFNGRLVREGQPVAFADAKEIVLTLSYHKNGERFGIPIQPDGSFKIGWMPIGEYSGALEVTKELRPGERSGAPNRYQLPTKFEIKEGQTEYNVELGKEFKA